MGAFALCVSPLPVALERRFGVRDGPQGVGLLFIQADGKAMAFRAAIVGGRAVGVPGALRMLEMAHAEYGRLPWANLFEPAIRLAENGFPVSQRLHTLLKVDPHLM